MRADLLPPNATPVEAAVAGAMMRLTEVPTPIRELANPDTCPVGLLPWLARYVGVDGWNTDWSEAVKRERVRQAVNIQRHKGTAKAVRDAVASLGASAALREWWETTPQGAPHTFDVTVTVTGSGAVVTPTMIDDCVAEIERVKPVRSRFTFTQGLAAAGEFAAFGAGRAALFVRLDMAAATGI